MKPNVNGCTLLRLPPICCFLLFFSVPLLFGSSSPLLSSFSLIPCIFQTYCDIPDWDTHTLPHTHMHLQINLHNDQGSTLWQSIYGVENWHRKHWTWFTGSCAVPCPLIQVVLREKWHWHHSIPMTLFLFMSLVLGSVMPLCTRIFLFSSLQNKFAPCLES